MASKLLTKFSNEVSRLPPEEREKLLKKPGVSKRMSELHAERREAKRRRLAEDEDEDEDENEEEEDGDNGDKNPKGGEEGSAELVDLGDTEDED